MEDKAGFAEQMPQAIGRYQVQVCVGYGAMGAVYKAFDPLIKRTLAIKTIRLDIPRNSPQYKSFIERFYHEARISGTLSHPNIVTLFDIGEEGGLPYLAMEYVEGDTLASLIDKGVRFNPEKVINLISQMASAMDYAHSRGVIHRDIKPSNLILYEGDRVKVTDFGIAKLMDAEMTQSGTLLGTPSYMSPEQAMGEKLDGRSDIFSLGVCAFEMLSGEQPFPGNNVTSILYKLVHVEPIQPANLEMNGLVPSKWHEVFNKVLAKKPDERYQTATAFVQDLEYCLGSWFGAMGDETLVEASGAATMAVGPTPVGESLTRSIPPLGQPGPPLAAPAAAPVSEDTTRALPIFDPPPPPPVVAQPARPAATAPPPEPPTVQPSGADDGDDLPPTVFMKTPPPAKTQPAEVGATVVLGAVQPQTAASSAPASEPTVLMAAPGAAGTAPGPAVEATVVMSVPEATVRSPVRDVTAKAPPAAPKPGSAAAPSVSGKASPAKGVPATPAARPAPPARSSAPPKPSADAPPVAPRAPGTRAKAGGAGIAWILLGLAALFLVTVAVVGLFVWRRLNASGATTTQASAPPTVRVTPPPSPVVTTAPVVATGTIHVETQPSGAKVTLKGESKGAAPLDIANLPLGIYELKFELAGYESKSQAVALTTEAPDQQVKVLLSKAQPAVGIVDVLSTPFGATVIMDGARVGQTPLADLKVRPGNHRFEITREGYQPYSADVTVEAGKRVKVDASLKAAVRVTPAPTPEAVDTAKVYENRPPDVETLARKISGEGVPSEKQPKLKSGQSLSVAGSFVVTESGDVADVKVDEPSGNKVVDEAVAASVRGWKYIPATKRGVKVKVRIQFKQTFKAG